MKRIFKVITVAQLALTAYNYYMEQKRYQEVKELSKKIDGATIS